MAENETITSEEILRDDIDGKDIVKIDDNRELTREEKMDKELEPEDVEEWGFD